MEAARALRQPVPWADALGVPKSFTQRSGEIASVAERAIHMDGPPELLTSGNTIEHLL